MKCKITYNPSLLTSIFQTVHPLVVVVPGGPTLRAEVHMTDGFRIRGADVCETGILRTGGNGCLTCTRCQVRGRLETEA